MTKKTELANVMSQDTLALLRESFPVEPSFNRTLLPRLSLVSQDVTEGKGKAMKVITEAGTFLTEKETEEKNEAGKKIWAKEEIGTEIEAIIFFKRKQLKFYDGEKYTSSPVYDTDDQIIPLFKDKQEVDRGTPAELKSRPIYQGKSAKGKDISKLEENRVLYVLYKGEPYQMNLRGNSMYAFMSYSKSVVIPSVVTKMSSEAKENGAIAWNQMTFEAVRSLNEKEGQEVVIRLKEAVESIKQEKEYFAQTDEEKANAKEVSKF